MKTIINTYQHGFMKGRSTTTNLVTITEFIYDAINSHSQVDVIYTDFSKAFDRQDHRILINNLDQHFGFSTRLINFFTSYLIERIEHVECYGHSSSK